MYLPANWWHQFEQPFEDTGALNFWTPPRETEDPRLQLRLLWDGLERELVNLFGNRAGYVHERLATGAEDGSVHLWDVSAFDDVSGARAQAELVQTLSIDHCEILCIAPSADGTALFCGLDDGTFALLGAA